MVGRRYFKCVLREIKSSFGRFVAIIAIVALGVGFLVGLLSATPDMRASADRFYKKGGMADLFIRSASGFSQAELDALGALGCVGDVLPAYVTDTQLVTGGDETATARLYGLPLLETGGVLPVNRLTLVEGRMPSAQNECVVQLPIGDMTAVGVGDTLRLPAASGGLYTELEYTVVGVVRNPFYFSTEREFSRVGSGRVDMIVYADESCYAPMPYTDVFLTVAGADEFEAYSSGYEDAVSAAADEVEQLAPLSETGAPLWYVLDRRANTSYVSYEANVEKVADIAKIFPVFFFLVAVLVTLTTMTRMVEEERVQIGTLKALGYSKAKILLYYIGYSVLASLGGSVTGVVLGFYTLPAVISNVYGMMYTLPAAITDFYWGYAALIVPISVACTTAATLFACLAQLSERPAALLLPRAPKSGKRILLERAGFVWRRMGFIKKVTARNIFRYKKRLFMTVFGIAGCTALLVTAFGLRDSIHDIVDKQFGELYRYNLSLYLSEDSATETDEILKACLANTERVTSSALFHSESALVSANGEKQRISLCVPKNTGELKKNIVLRERKTGADVPFGESSVVLTEKLCEQLNVSAGDTVSVENADGRTATLTVSGIAENYVTGYVFLPAEVYRQAFGETPEYKLALVTVTDESPEARDALSTDILQSDRVLLAQFSQTIRESFENTVKSIDSIVVVLIIAAGALAVIVLYNLTNINICEREKELATIKVLGFYDQEVYRYIFREIELLALIGSGVGLALGVPLHKFIVLTVEMDQLMFIRTIALRSYLLAVALTMVFTVVVCFVMRRHVRRISMVESMKAPE